MANVPYRRSRRTAPSVERHRWTSCYDFTCHRAIKPRRKLQELKSTGAEILL